MSALFQRKMTAYTQVVTGNVCLHFPIGNVIPKVYSYNQAALVIPPSLTHIYFPVKKMSGSYVNSSKQRGQPWLGKFMQFLFPMKEEW